MDDSAKEVLSLMADVSTLLVSFAQKNMELTQVFTRAMSEGRLPTDAEHKEVRQGFADQLEKLKELYKTL